MELTVIVPTRNESATIEELVAHRFVYTRGGEDLWVEEAERRVIAQHLDEFVAAGRAAEEGGRWRMTG